MYVGAFLAGAMSVLVVIAVLIFVFYAYAKKHNLLKKGEKDK